MLDVVGPLTLAVVGVGAIVWGAESFAENLVRASKRLGVSTFALALVLAGAEPEELATAVAATVRGAPAIAFGDVVGANVAICLVALGVGAVVAPLPFGARVFRYGMLGVPTGLIAVVFSWDGEVGRGEGLVLVVLYVVYVAAIWIVERRPPTLGEAVELNEVTDQHADPSARRIGQELGIVLAGLAAMVIGATLLVDGVKDLVDAEATQTRVSLTIIGFVTAFELVVLAWSSARRGISEVVVAGVVGSYAYNATMTLGAAAVVEPLRVNDAGPLHVPMLAMVIVLAAALVLAARRRCLGRREGVLLLAAYPVFVIIVLRA